MARSKPRIKEPRLVLHNGTANGKWAVVSDGSGPDDMRLLRDRLDNARIKWDTDSCELCLELIEPTLLEVVKCRQLVNEIAASKIHVRW